MNSISLTHVKFIQVPSYTAFGDLHFFRHSLFHIDSKIYIHSMALLSI